MYEYVIVNPAPWTCRWTCAPCMRRAPSGIQVIQSMVWKQGSPKIIMDYHHQESSYVYIHIYTYIIMIHHIHSIIYPTVIIILPYLPHEKWSFAMVSPFSKCPSPVPPAVLCPRSCKTETADESKIFMAKFVRGGSLLGWVVAGSSAVKPARVNDLCKITCVLLYILLIYDLMIVHNSYVYIIYIIIYYGMYI